MYRYMNRFTYRVSTLSTQPMTKLSKMNRFTVLESQNRLSTTPFIFMTKSDELRRNNFVSRLRENI